MKILACSVKENFNGSADLYNAHKHITAAVGVLLNIVEAEDHLTLPGTGASGHKPRHTPFSPYVSSECSS